MPAPQAPSASGAAVQPPPRTESINQHGGMPPEINTNRLDAPHQGKPTTSEYVETKLNDVKEFSRFAEKNLMPGEQILYSARVNKMVFLPAYIFGSLALIGVLLSLMSFVFPGLRPIGLLVIVLGALMSAVYAIQALEIYLTTECVLTNSRVLGKRGLLNRSSTELLLKQIEGLAIAQSIFGRFFDYGTVTVTGTGSSKSTFSGIASPLAFRKAVQEQVALAQRGATA